MSRRWQTCAGCGHPVERRLIRCQRCRCPTHVRHMHPPGSASTEEMIVECLGWTLFAGGLIAVGVFLWA